MGKPAPAQACGAFRREHGGDEESEQYLRKQIEDHPNIAVFEGERPVAWSLVHWDGAIGPCFTLPEARGRGYASTIAWELSRVLLEMGRIPYFYTLQENPACGSMSTSRHSVWPSAWAFAKAARRTGSGLGEGLRRGSIAVEKGKSGSFAIG
ncbi:MAG: GNAT family N-acetyltransferase [Coprothermobacterota bacterium]|nr:GNAT family N-acetyltransferase [Coprothermobacterota bacterium]